MQHYTFLLKQRLINRRDAFKTCIINYYLDICLIYFHLRVVNLPFIAATKAGLTLLKMLNALTVIILQNRNEIKSNQYFLLYILVHIKFLDFIMRKLMTSRDVSLQDLRTYGPLSRMFSKEITDGDEVKKKFFFRKNNFI